MSEEQDRHPGPSRLQMLYVKRPDLRPNELPLDADPDKFDAFLPSWQWWIDSHTLYDEELKSNHHEIHAMGLPYHPEVHGIPDPAKIMAYFCSCHEWGVYPPAWIMDEIYKKFSAYLDDNVQGKARRLGEYFGEPARGNRRGVFGKFAFAHVMEQAMLDIDRFIEWFALPRKDAIALVEQYLDTITNPTTHRFDKGFSALDKAYKKWKNQGMTNTVIEVWKKNPPPREYKITMLKRYPRDAFIAYPRLQEYLKE